MIIITIISLLSLAILFFMWRSKRHVTPEQQAQEDAEQIEYLHGYDLLRQSERAGRVPKGPMASVK